MILLAIDLVMRAGASLRSAAATLALLAQHGYGSADTPCASTIRLWLIRIGCARLNRPLPNAGPWVWLVDHTLQIGTQKLLVIVGCPLASVPFGQRSLTFGDLELVAVVPMEKSTAALVDTEFKKAAERTGIPGQIISDEGSDLRGGIQLFQQGHNSIRDVMDVAHAVANILKHSWDKDPRWQQFTQHMHQTSASIRQTKAAHLLAPKLRNKARYMTVAKYIRFARMLLRHLRSKQPQLEVLKHYEWVLEFEMEIRVWEEQYAAVQVVLRQVRLEGLFSRSLAMIEEEWKALLLSESASTQMVLHRLREYIVRHTATLKPGERLVGSTEILESVFGVQKRMSGDQVESGLTRLVLMLGLIVGTHTAETVKEDLESVPEKQTEGWAKRMLGKTVQWLRRQFFKTTKNEAESENEGEPNLG